MGEDEVLEHAVRQSGRVASPLEALADQDRLRGMLQDHGIAGDRAPATTVLTAVR